MFEPQKTPRVFALAPGQDFPAALVAGLRVRLAGAPPEAMARVTVYVSTRRMQRRIETLFADGSPGFLPRIRLVTEAGADLLAGTPPVPLARQLELTRLVGALLAAQPDLAPAAAAFDLAGGLAALMDEAEIEAVPFGRILDLDVADQSGHWQRSLQFLRIVAALQSGETPPGTAARQRLAVDALIRAWAAAPPAAPVLVAGSTGSRGTTHRLMLAAARLPQGALVLPGFDHDLPLPVWTALSRPEPQEDHPQYRFAALLGDLGMAPDAVRPWLAGAGAPDPARNRLISMALRPAPVTDGWMRDGPGLGDLGQATARLTLIEAPDPRAEAQAVALVLRGAVERGQPAALVSPDRMLTRRVAAALDRWGIEPDDSAGEPLGQTAVGRLLRHLAQLFGERLTAEALVILLRNPLVATGARRGPHLRWSRELELSLRRDGPPFPDAAGLAAWAAKRDDPELAAWAAWAGACVAGLETIATRPVGEHLADLLARAGQLAAGPGGAGTGALWDGKAGETAAVALADLAGAAPHGGAVDPLTFTAILRGVMQTEVRDPALPHPGVAIWGTLEARVQGAELVILAGLNDGVWPEQPAPDPWLNRAMRKAAGLLLPERRIGLSAHDFQQAASAPEVVLSRARRTAEADAVPSRWLNRLTNLLDGLPGQGGPQALAEMRGRGAHWVAMAAGIDRPDMPEPAAPRPSPVPPVAARPRRLSVTEVETLLRDPYQIYARHVLRLRPLDPLRHRPDPRERGSVLHAVLETAIPQFHGLQTDARRALLLDTAEQRLAVDVPWPAARRFWLARLARIADALVAGEAVRGARGRIAATEIAGAHLLPGTGVLLTVKADRIDIDAGGMAWIYDYKTGNLPTERQRRIYAKQLHITAWLAEAGAFEALGPVVVRGAEYIGLGSTPVVVPVDFVNEPVTVVPELLDKLFRRFLSAETGFTAQVARESQGDFSAYDHLSRGGEWDLTDPAEKLRVGDWP